MPNPSIKNEKVYRALRRQGMSKQRAARISNAQAHKDAGTTAGDPLAGPGGLLGEPGMGTTRRRKWGQRRGTGITTKPMTRSEAASVAAHARWDKTPRKAKPAPKGRASGTGATPAPRTGRTPAKTEQERQRARDATRTEREAARHARQVQQRADVLRKLNIAPDGQQALEALRSGQQPDAAAVARGGFVQAGLVEQAADGSYRMTPAGRALLSAADAGDAGRAGATISSGRDRTGARTARQNAAAERKRQTEAKRTAPKPAKSGGSGKKQPVQEAAPSKLSKAAQRRQARLRRRLARRLAQQAKRTTPPLPAPVSPTPKRPAPRQGLPSDPARGRGTIPSRKSFAVFKDASGAHRWIARSTTAYRDRDGEIITERSLDADAARMTATKQYGPLRYWHIGEPDPFDVAAPWGPGLDIGDCDYSIVIGRTAIESGTFKSAALGRAFAASADDYELSPGFFHPMEQPNAAGEYDDIRRFERSVVPVKYGRASNLFTGMTVKEHRMDDATYKARVEAFMKDMNAKGVPIDAAASALAGMERADKSATAQGIAFKSETLVDPWAAVTAALKAAVMPAEKAPMPPAEMIAAGETELDDGADDEGEEEGSYIGDMSIADFELLLGRALQSAIQQFGGDITTRMAAMDEAVKGMGYARTKAESAATAEITALKTRLAELEGNKPAVTLPSDIEAALKSTGPATPPDPNALPAPENPVQAYAMQTFPQLYQQTPQGGWAGWAPPTPLPPNQS